MIFEANKSSDLSKIAVSEVIEQISLVDFLREAQNYKKIVTCPVNALNLEENSINFNCNDCGLCWIFNENIITKKEGVSDFNSFKKHVCKDKMFVYKWLSLSLSNYSGIEISSVGFSRNKRIPLIVKADNTLYFAKAIRDITDIKKAELEVQDIIDLSKDLLAKYETKILLIVIDNSNFDINIDSALKVNLKDIYQMIILKGKQDIGGLI